MSPEDPERHIESTASAVSAGIALDNDLGVDWDGPDDPAKPKNWSPLRRWSIVILMTCMSHIAGLASTIFAPEVPQLMEEFGSSNSALESLVVSIYVAGFGLGPLLVAPLSELYGRLPVLYASNVVYLGLTVACGASSSLSALIALRILAGLAGSTPLTLGGSIVADLMGPQERPRAMSVWSSGTLMGTLIGPIVGGYAGQALGWRWMFWLVCILVGVVLLASPIVLCESYEPVLLSRKAARLRRASEAVEKRESPATLFARAIVRPSKLLLQSGTVAILALQTAVAYAYGYLLFTTFTFVFGAPAYGFNTGEVGLAYLGVAVGFLVAIPSCNRYASRLEQRRSKVAMQDPDAVDPEQHLRPLVLGAFLLPAGLLWYGWTAQSGVHFIVPLLGTAVVGAGIIATWLPIQLYLIEIYPMYAASALATNTIVRSLVGGVMPICGKPMYQRLGLGWGNTLLAVVAAVMIAVPFTLLRYGKSVRERERINL